MGMRDDDTLREQRPAPILIEAPARHLTLVKVFIAIWA
jgi:hypothetical protein